MYMYSVVEVLYCEIHLLGTLKILLSGTSLVLNELGSGSLGAAIKQQVFTWPEFHIVALCNWGKTFQAFSWY